jgi:hypothetical protein
MDPTDPDPQALLGRLLILASRKGILQGREADHLRHSDAGVDGEEASWIRIQEAQKHIDSTDPDPQHCLGDSLYMHNRGIFQGREADHLRNSDAGVDGEEAAAHQGGGGGRRQRHSRRVRLRHALRRDGQGVRRKLAL